MLAQVEPYIQMEEFTPDAVAKVSKACTSICMFVRAMYVYHNVALQVRRGGRWSRGGEGRDDATSLVSGPNFLQDDPRPCI